MFEGFQAVPGAVVPYQYNWPMVGLSFLISVCGAYVALRWSRGIRRADGSIDADRLLCASVALGGGAVWAMHFIGMVAYRTPTGREFDLLTTLGSLVVVMAFVAAGLARASRHTGSVPGNIVAGGVLTGLGVTTMHYTGMAAIHTNSRFEWDWNIVALSTGIAVVVSIVGLWLATTVKTRGWQVVAAFVMGVAVCGMHYTGMAAGTMICTSRTYSPTLLALEGTNMGYAIFALAAAVLTFIFIVEATRSAARAK
ncbi:MHYT domain-containing protein [Cupriavidus sp. DL-D2]|uniref:MHYT domain-containing protein n=1 Tax=Cupriavidus sp. DL-D2 TaxID=3144974 RepID=UPI0032124F26